MPSKRTPELELVPPMNDQDAYNPMNYSSDPRDMDLDDRFETQIDPLDAEFATTDEPPALEPESGEAQESRTALLLPPDPNDYKVPFGSREFQIIKPDSATVVRLANIIATIWVRGERYAAFNLKGLFANMVSKDQVARTEISIPYDMIVGSLIASLDPEDLDILAVLLFFGGDRRVDRNVRGSREREGLQYIKDTFGQDGVPIAPLIKAFSYRLALSSDLAEALKNLPLVQAAAAIWTNMYATPESIFST
jgi:hypothetical protein